MIEKLPRDTAVAVGFVGCPYPGFRLPGWNRGSLGVHSDDGRRYCNDSYGGKDFTMPFREGEVVGIGMCFRVWFFVVLEADVNRHEVSGCEAGRGD